VRTILSNTDQFMWSLGGDPVLHSTIVSLITLERAPDWELLLDRLDRMSVVAPQFRHRVARPVFGGVSTWQPDPDFDIGFHVRRIGAPAPGDRGVLLELARRAAMDGFDCGHSQWSAVLVEGMADGGAALLCRFDHALTDGIGAVGLARWLVDGPDAPESVAVDARLDRRGSLRTAATLSLQAARLAADTIVHPLDAISSAASTVASLYRTARPILRPGSPIMRGRSAARRVAVLDVPAAHLRAAGHSAGGSLNDAFLAAVVGGLHRYHRHHGVSADDLVLSMPVNVRREADPAAGNRATLARFSVSTRTVDPAQRIRAIAERTGRVRREKSLDHVDLAAFAVNLMPHWYIDSQLRHVDCIASDVPGIAEPVRLAGAPVRMQYAFAPTLGAALNATLLTYAGVCGIGLNIDTGACPDFEVVGECIAAGFDEVLELA
jgi:diacylglycerol O-acyltransferase